MGILVMSLVKSNVYGNAFDILHDTFTVAGSGILGEDKILVTGTIDNKLSLWMIDHDLTFMEERTFNYKKNRAGVDVVGLPSTDMVLMGTEKEDNGSIDLFLMKLNYSGRFQPKKTSCEKLLTFIPIRPKINCG